MGEGFGDYRRAVSSPIRNRLSSSQRLAIGMRLRTVVTIRHACGDSTTTRNIRKTKRVKFTMTKKSGPLVSGNFVPLLDERPPIGW